jgi:hypothetical protein
MGLFHTFRVHQKYIALIRKILVKIRSLLYDKRRIYLKKKYKVDGFFIQQRNHQGDISYKFKGKERIDHFNLMFQKWEEDLILYNF